MPDTPNNSYTKTQELIQEFITLTNNKVKDDSNLKKQAQKIILILSDYKDIYSEFAPLYELDPRNQAFQIIQKDVNTMQKDLNLAFAADTFSQDIIDTLYGIVKRYLKKIQRIEKDSQKVNLAPELYYNYSSSDNQFSLINPEDIVQKNIEKLKNKIMELPDLPMLENISQDDIIATNNKFLALQSNENKLQFSFNGTPLLIGVINTLFSDYKNSLVEVKKIRINHQLCRTFGAIVKLTRFEGTKIKIINKLKQNNSAKNSIGKAVRRYDELSQFFHLYTGKNNELKNIQTEVDVLFKSTFGKIFLSIDEIKKSLNIEIDTTSIIDDITNLINEINKSLLEFNDLFLYFISCTKYLPNYVSILSSQKLSIGILNTTKKNLTLIGKSLDEATKLLSDLRKFFKSKNPIFAKTRNSNKELYKKADLEFQKAKSMFYPNKLLLLNSQVQTKYATFGPILAKNIKDIKLRFYNVIYSLSAFIDNSRSCSSLADFKIEANIFKKCVTETNSYMKNLKITLTFAPFFPPNPIMFSKENLIKEFILGNDGYIYPLLFKPFINFETKDSLEIDTNNIVSLYENINGKQIELEDNIKKIQKIDTSLSHAIAQNAITILKFILFISAITVSAFTPTTLSAIGNNSS